MWYVKCKILKYANFKVESTGFQVDDLHISSFLCSKLLASPTVPSKARHSRPSYRAYNISTHFKTRGIFHILG